MNLCRLFIEKWPPSTTHKWSHRDGDAPVLSAMSARKAASFGKSAAIQAISASVSPWPSCGPRDVGTRRYLSDQCAARRKTRPKNPRVGNATDGRVINADVASVPSISPERCRRSWRSWRTRGRRSPVARTVARTLPAAERRMIVVELCTMSRSPSLWSGMPKRNSRGSKPAWSQQICSRALRSTSNAIDSSVPLDTAQRGLEALDVPGHQQLTNAGRCIECLR